MNYNSSLNIDYNKKGEKSNMDYGNLLRQARMEHGISQQKLADISGVTKRSIAYWESGKQKMTIESAEKVFGALKVKVTIGGDE